MRDRIIKCTLSQLRRYGLQGLKMDNIAAELHISKRTIYVYFTSKDELVKACLKSWLDHKKIFAHKEKHLIDTLCTLYTRIQRIDLPEMLRSTQALREYCFPAYEFFLEQIFEYAEACGAQAERDQEEGFLYRNITRNTVSVFVADFLIRSLTRTDSDIIRRHYFVTPDLLLVFTRGICSIKGRAHLDQRLKKMGLK